MKKSIFFLFIMAIVAACDDFDELNENVKDPATVPGESLFTGAQKNLSDQMVSTSVNRNPFRLFAQYWAQASYPQESQYKLTRRSIPERHWRALYRDVLKDLDEAAKVIKATELLSTDDPVVKENKLQITEIFSVYAYSILVETFGNVPYTEALDIENLSPKYDDGLTVYEDLLKRLDVAISKLDVGHDSFTEKEDNIYQGDVAAWLKFANSLKLRMGMLLVDVDNAKAKKIVEEAVAAGVFQSNADNASMTYLASPPNTNPLYASLVLSGRSDFMAANTIIDIMQPRKYGHVKDTNEDGAIDEKDDLLVVPGSVTYTDPRAKHYFDDNIDADATVPDSIAKVVYLGGHYGQRNKFDNFTHIGKKLHEATFDGIILDYVEIEFLLAEAAERGYAVGGSAEDYYNKAITASIEFWGGTAQEATDYLARPEVAYGTAGADFKEKIGIQKWIALYNRGFTAWREWRRLDYPKLEKPSTAVSEIPVRYTYPIVEQTLNPDSWAQARDAIGGDAVTTKLFWDKN